MSASRVEQQVQAGADDRVVVHDQHADPSASSLSSRPAPRPRPSCPAPSVDSIASLPSSSPTRSFIPTSPSPSLGAACRRRSPARRPRSRRSPSSRVLVTTMLTRVALGVLADVRQRLLHDPVEGGLDLRRRGAACRGSPGCRPRSRTARRTPRASRSSAGSEAEVVERARPQLDREPPDVLERVDDLLAQLRRGRCAPPRAISASSTCLRPSRIEVSAWPVSSWSSRASRRRSSSCPSTTRRSASRATRSARSTATAARAAKVSARRRSSSVKRGSAPELVVRGDHADRPVGDDHRHEEARAQADAPRDLLVDLDVLERRVDPLAPAPLEHAPALRAVRARASSRPAPRRPARRPPRSAGRPPPHGDRDHDELGVDQRRAAASPIRWSSGCELRLAGQRVPDLGQRLELRQPARRRLVQARVLDRDRRLRGEQRDELLVLGGEVLAALLLGQVEVAVGDAAQEDRHAEERPHRRVVRREADRARVGRQVVQPERAARR